MNVLERSMTPDVGESTSLRMRIILEMWTGFLINSRSLITNSKSVRTYSWMPLLDGDRRTYFAVNRLIDLPYKMLNYLKKYWPNGDLMNLQKNLISQKCLFFISKWHNIFDQLVHIICIFLTKFHFLFQFFIQFFSSLFKRHICSSIAPRCRIVHRTRSLMQLHQQLSFSSQSPTSSQRAFVIFLAHIWQTLIKFPITNTPTLVIKLRIAEKKSTLLQHNHKCEKNDKAHYPVEWTHKY